MTRSALPGHRAVLAGADRARDALALFAETSTRLQRLMPFDAAVWRATDPLTGLTTAPVLVENLNEGGCGAYWECELLGENINLFRDLSRAEVPAVGLRESTGDRQALSVLYRKFMLPRGFDDELRAVLRVGGQPWGMLSLFRERGRRPFDAGDAGFVGSLSAPLARRLRSYAQPAPTPVSTAQGGPGLLLFDSADVLVSINEDARRLLAEMPPGPSVATRFGVALPAWILTMATYARTATGDENARIRIPTRTGHWLVCHGSRLREPDGRPGATAMVIEPAKVSEVASLVMAAYELSPRELEITRLIARGLPTRDIADRLHLSPHTVRDHVKAVFDKVGVTSRGELVAALFTEHCEPLAAANTVRVLGEPPSVPDHPSPVRSWGTASRA
ncbi:helix-turn-helix transcriptional regulator [Streptomyces millisiae]|uniref:Helix-turn-helix transcriptional regulator n=1 Tax=Streptomyces millisiae TaxID=3075542 RepID=A0ABU2LNF6_9ACTN|nr:helix-turn-helix transcriptional regulator [Streptomyces sp. DSM 44918]MDT0319126.1 helix-turn-helix transcriptional regulator [Streptomyces sp. DSM 44918]